MDAVPCSPGTIFSVKRLSATSWHSPALAGTAEACGGADPFSTNGISLIIRSAQNSCSSTAAPAEVESAWLCLQALARTV